MNTVGFFDEVDPDKCGGKGKNLIALSGHRFPVPPGFVVTVDAYSLYQSQTGVPASVEQAITDCYRRLAAETGSGKVAVRSSASAEDGAKTSFAGLHDTYLDIEGEDGVLDHVVECWRSLHSERASLYRKLMRVAPENQAMAVVVQSMVNASAAGVVFTANPYNMSATEMIVESSRGCGENVVAGKVTPDYFEIRKNDGFDIVKKMLGSDPAGAGSNWVAARGGDGEQPRGAYSITDRQLRVLCALARQIESIFGGPQDIEWALREDGSFAILQSRPLAKFDKR